ncbi:TRM44 [Candida pseudojiufengensis]|uniref:TRM44 n=1 Tax=Candida pseudojiufengensis TaxID=497109 RepID=UPI00222568BD|nr:TRM44 [Candida pseudojiufengensis]KAI5966559.1 TRM44 [Candida pseudojiufengensis]
MGYNKQRGSKNEPDITINTDSILGSKWCPICETKVNFEPQHFQTAMINVIKNPNINSTVLLRADILIENSYDPEKGNTKFTSNLIDVLPDIESNTIDNENVKNENKLLHRDLQDVNIRKIPISDSKLKLSNRIEIVRRMIPRNPFKDHIVNQTCLLLKSDDNNTILIVYIPHINSKEEIPYYLPQVLGVGILYDNQKVSIHYLPFENELNFIKSIDQSNRIVRTAIRLLQTSTKHSNGVKIGYSKRVNHDLIVPKVNFQNKYIYLKSKYSSDLVNNWKESTDPNKHVFEDLAIAAFLIEYWNIKNFAKDKFEFRDLGCGNGLLVYILIMEGYKGEGIDARSRKSWKTYPKFVQDKLFEQIIVPSILLKPHPSVSKLIPEIQDNGRTFNDINDTQAQLSSNNLLNSPNVCTTQEFPSNTFLIGNHSDELTCWMPLLGFPFMVIPCCSHALNGNKIRYPPPKKHISKQQQLLQHQQPVSSSTYASLVDHVEKLSILNGWEVEKEMLRIPSTRNAAIMSCNKIKEFLNEPSDISQLRILDIIAMEGGADGWVENSLNLMKKAPRSH